MKKLILTLTGSLVLTFSAFSQEKFTLSGYVKDKGNGETLIGATVLIRELSSGNVTNVYGFYSLTVPAGVYTIEYRYIGYQTITHEVELMKNVRLDVELAPGEQQLQEVVVSGRAEDANVSELEMSTVELDIKTIEKIPAFLGEVDVVKSLQLLPGVTSVGEGASGFNVRGGSVGQNLILLDEAPVYNSSHMFGFFSVFNPDAVKDVKLYKGGIPAEYGGRLSSILDVRMKEGNIKQYELNGGIGTIFSRFAVEGPLLKDRSSFILAGRRSYIDVLAKPFLNEDLDGVGLYFYDLTFKTNYYISDKDRIYLSAYLGRDNFKFDAEQGFNWGNKTATIRWNHLFNDRIFSNTTFFVSDYDYAFEVGETSDDMFRWSSRIFTYNLKEQFSYFINTNNELSFGGEAILYRFSPADVLGVSAGSEVPVVLDERKSLEAAIYVGNEQRVNDKLTLQYGLRYSYYNYLGAGSVFSFDETVPAGERRPVTTVEQADEWESIKTYSRPEPRFSFKYQISPTASIKGSYNRMTQYIHLISNTTASLPIDVWMSSTNNLRPQQGDQVALGIFKNFFSNQYEASFETYYKWTKNQVDYIDGAEILINELLEGDLLSGEGRAYGAEFYLKKNAGRLTGWLAYTLARTELKVPGINKGLWYPTRYDQKHNLKLNAVYELSERIDISSSFTYISGTPFTTPETKFVFNDIPVPVVGARNNARIPDYHRLDLALTLNMRKYKPDGTLKKLEDYWVFTLYNVYGRRNPFSIYFSQGTERIPAGEIPATSATQVAILGSIVPAVSYNFKF